MKYIKIFICILIIYSVTINITSIFGTNMEVASFLDDIVGEGKNFFQPGSGTQVGNIGTVMGNAIKDSLIPIIKIIGNLIFYIVAAFLGLKYIWSSVEGKSQVKETLPTFVVAACIFYLATTIYDFTIGVVQDITSGSNFEAIQGSLWENIAIVVNVLAIAGIVALGLKYMFASADTRADIKKDMFPVAVGLVLIYAITSFLNFLVSAGAQILT